MVPSRYPLDWRVFADTCVVNRIVDFGEYFFDNCLNGKSLLDYERRPLVDQQDIDALRDILCVYFRACIPFYISSTVIEEVRRSKKEFLQSYAGEIFDHWSDWGHPSVLKRYLHRGFDRAVGKTAAKLTQFKGQADRKLLAEARAMGCDVFLTVDRRSIWNRRQAALAEHIVVMRPVELWEELLPWSHLVC